MLNKLEFVVNVIEGIEVDVISEFCRILMFHSAKVILFRILQCTLGCTEIWQTRVKFAVGRDFSQSMKLKKNAFLGLRSVI